jgi:hypothetical protein
MRRGPDVVIEPVTHVEGFGCRTGDRLQHPGEKCRIGLGHTPVVRCSDHVSGQIKSAEKTARTEGLVTGDADPQALVTQPGQGRPHARVKVILPEPLWFALLRCS